MKEFPPSLAAVLFPDQAMGYFLDPRCPEVGDSDIHVLSPIIVSRLSDMPLWHDRFSFSTEWVGKVWPFVVNGGLQRVRSCYLAATDDLIRYRLVFFPIGSVYPDFSGLFSSSNGWRSQDEKYLVQFGRRNGPHQWVDSSVDPPSGVSRSNPITSHQNFWARQESWQHRCLLPHAGLGIKAYRSISEWCAGGNRRGLPK